MDDQEIYRGAKRRVGKIKGFNVHATVYVQVNALLIAINLLTSEDHIWFFYPLLVSVKGNTDARADSTARMLAESAVCLVRDVPREATAGGVWTSCSAMGDALIRRLEANAGISFQVEY